VSFGRARHEGVWGSEDIPRSFIMLVLDAVSSQLHVPVPLPRVKSPRYQLKRFDQSQSLSGRSDEEVFTATAENQTKIHGNSAHSLPSIKTIFVLQASETAQWYRFNAH
jgi:hypothetical protein